MEAQATGRIRTAALSIGAMLLLAALWWAHAGAGARAQTNPRLASLEIDIWPEFDKPSALVILRGELAADATLPATLSVRIPTSSGGPAAVASATAADAQLLTVPFERSAVQVDFTTVTFQIPVRFFHVEFYDPLKTDGAARSYQYVWPGDFAVDRLRVQLQQPAGVAQVSVAPDLPESIVGAYGLVYREADLGAFEAGKPLSVDVSYEKTDSRTSAEILDLPTTTPEPAADDDDGGGIPRWLIGAALVAAAAALAGGALFWRRGKPGKPRRSR